jgi:hypothetical protein
VRWPSASTGWPTPTHATSAIASSDRRSGDPRLIVVALIEEAALLKGAALPVVAMLVAWVARAGLETGVTAALWTAGVELFALEIMAGLRRRLPIRERAVETVMGAGLGGGILALRVLLH